MLEYEDFLLESFPVFKDHYQYLEDNFSKLAQFRRRAIRYLEMNCSSTWGFPAEAHVFSDPTSKSYYMIPTSYDSGLLLPLLKDEGLDKTVIDALVYTLKKSRQKSGFWNFFIHEKDLEADLFPDDIDDTSVPMMALYLTGNLSEEECKSTGKRMIESSMLDKNGVMATWLTVPPTRKIAHEKYLKKPYMCAGCLSNALWFLAHFGLDTEDRVKPSVDYIDKWVDLLTEKKDSWEEEEGMVYYTNKYLIYFFVGRYISASEYARKKFGGKFVDLVMIQLRNLVEGLGNKDKVQWGLDISCMILAVTVLRLHKREKDQQLIENGYKAEGTREMVLKLADKLLELQGRDGSFAPRVVYRWNRLGHYGGSKVYTTGMALAAISVVEREILKENGNKIPNGHV